MRWVVYGLGVVVLGILVLVYEFSGIKYYWEMSDFVSSRKVEEKVAMEKEVFGNSLESTYGGVFLRATDKGIWVWGRGGPRFFAKEEGVSAYIFFDTCNQEMLKQLEINKTASIAREVDANLNAWQKRLKMGKYVFVRYDKNNSQVIKEAYAYGGWYFLDINLKEQCARQG